MTYHPSPPNILSLSRSVTWRNCGLFKDIENTLVQGASKCFRKLGGVNTTTIIREHFMYFKNLITNSTTNKKKIKWYKRLKNENSNQIMIPLNSLKECIWCKFCWPFHSQGLNNIHRTICHQLLRQERSWGGGGVPENLTPFPFISFFF